MALPKETTSVVEMQAELRFLRQRNGDLQSQLESLLKLHEEYGETGMDSAPSSSLNDGREHRRTDELKEQPMKSYRSNSIASPGENLHGCLHHRRMDRSSSEASSASIRHAGVKSIVSGRDRQNFTPPAPGSSAEAGVANGRIRDEISRGRLKRKISSDHSIGHYMQALSIDHGDEEEGRIPDLHIEVSQDPNDDDVTDEELDNLIDDDSHNKHVPKGAIPGSTLSNSKPAPMLAAFPPFKDQLKERAGWLIGLLVFQSCSSFIIQYNQRFLQKHMVIVQFLTMLVGAGGNAGNQAAVRVIRSLAVGTLNRRTMKWFLRNEAKMALSLSLLIGMTGFARAAIFRVPPGETIAVTASVCAIVAISVAIGNALPLGMKRVGIDPAHSSTTIQVVMDILGVLITVCVSSFVLSFKVFRDEDIDSIMKSSTSSTLPMSTVK
ncbi:hypothetical protein ACHAXA_007295 [Cyclostephanos tholiformis]|uniref:SLC41A/MgtE integral membrane domain-containing protein n=1 Tax=Cyclostephanos tholiformis TaxID=382380 RepID=A0ABD3RVE6_9STRA